MSEPGSEPRKTPACLSDLLLDEIVVGTWPTPEAKEHADACERCAGRLRLFRETARAAAPSVARLLEASRRPRARPRASSSWPRVRWVFAGAAAVGLAVAVLVGVRSVQEPGEPTPRIKGTNLRFFVQRDGRVVPGVSGETYRVGDALRFVVSSDVSQWFFLAGIEANGRVSAYHPFGGTGSLRVEPGADQPLPGSLVLDDSRATEFFVGIFSREPTTLDAVRRAVAGCLQAEAASLRVLEGAELPGVQHWVVIRKEQ